MNVKLRRGWINEREAKEGWINEREAKEGVD
jgi:hypothetical protein